MRCLPAPSSRPLAQAPRFEAIRIDGDSFRKHLPTAIADRTLEGFQRAAQEMAPLLPNSQDNVDLWVRLSPRPFPSPDPSGPFSIQCQLKAKDPQAGAPDGLTQVENTLQQRLNETVLAPNRFGTSPYTVLAEALAQLSKVLMATMGEAFANRLADLETDSQALPDGDNLGKAEALSEKGARKLTQLTARLDQLTQRYDTMAVRYQSLREDVEYCTKTPEVIQSRATSLIDSIASDYQNIDALNEGFHGLRNLYGFGLEPLLSRLSESEADSHRAAANEPLNAFKRRTDALSEKLVILMQDLGRLMPAPYNGYLFLF